MVASRFGLNSDNLNLSKSAILVSLGNGGNKKQMCIHKHPSFLHTHLFLTPGEMFYIFT